MSEHTLTMGRKLSGKVESIGNNLWQLPSSSNPDDCHIIWYDESSNIYGCDCKGYMYREDCSHVQAVITTMKELDS